MPTTQLDDDHQLAEAILGITGPANAAQHDADMNVVAAMHQWGGSFVKQLAALAERADYHNLQRIKAAWPEHWAAYAKMHASRDQIAALQTRMAQAAGDKDAVYCRHNHRHYSESEAEACNAHHKEWGS